MEACVGYQEPASYRNQGSELLKIGRCFSGNKMRDLYFSDLEAKTRGNVLHLLKIFSLYCGTFIDVQEGVIAGFFWSVIFFEGGIEGRGRQCPDNMDLRINQIG